MVKRVAGEVANPLRQVLDNVGDRDAQCAGGRKLQGLIVRQIVDVILSGPARGRAYGGRICYVLGRHRREVAGAAARVLPVNTTRAVRRRYLPVRGGPRVHGVYFKRRLEVVPWHAAHPRFGAAARIPDNDQIVVSGRAREGVGSGRYRGVQALVYVAQDRVRVPVAGMRHVGQQHAVIGCQPAGNILVRYVVVEVEGGSATTAGQAPPTARPGSRPPAGTR